LQFKDVAAAALNIAPQLLTAWIGGKRVGTEWQGAPTANGGPGNSWCVNLNTGSWGHFSGEERGKDLVSLYAALNHLEPLAALAAVGEQCGLREGSPPPLEQRKAPTSERAEEIPPDAPPIPAQSDLGEPVAIYWYGRDFVVARYETADGKTIRPLTWRKGRWTWKGYPAPKPIYHREFLLKYPDAPVLVVEGEKCADLASDTLKSYVVVAWAGGSNAVKQSDWSVLRGRDVILWPDADQPGRTAMAGLGAILAPLARRVRVINPGDQPEGWDVADAIQSGWTAKQIVIWAGERVSEPISAQSQQEYIPAEESQPQLDDDDAPPSASALVHWDDMGLKRDEGKPPFATMANVSLILRNYPQFRGKVWYDTFRDGIYHTINVATPQSWTDRDTRAVVCHIQQNLNLPKFSEDVIFKGIQHAADLNARNSVADWLDSLQWDGVPRLEDWLIDTSGCAKTDYTIAVSRNWPISMVARVYRPGCQVDTMVVLEGHMGRGKSSFLRILGGEWYCSVGVAFGSKEFLESIQGQWLIEIPDMSGFNRREHKDILQTVTTNRDRYRAAYGRLAEDHPRKCVFAATSEDDDYLQSSRGRRRFWPIACGDIDLELLAGLRDQVFAEAVYRYKAGESWHEMPAGTDAEQLARTSEDTWANRVLDYCNQEWDDVVRSGTKSKIATADILKRALDIDIGKQGHQDKIRVAKILQDDGWIQRRDEMGRYWRKVNRNA
jgi:predicted P-loop ATPase